MSKSLALCRSLILVSMIYIAMLLCACEPRYEDPQPGVSNPRYFNLVATANRSIREHQRFQGGFTDFAHLEFHSTLKQLQKEQQIHWLSSTEQDLLQQRYQAELRSLAPNSWPSHPKFMAATVINYPANYLILFVEIAHADKASSLAMLRIQNGFEFFSPAIMVSGYIESHAEQDKLRIWPTSNTTDHAYIIASSFAGNSDFAQYEYFLTSSKLCSLHDRSQLGVGPINLTVSPRSKTETPRTELAVFPVREAALADLPCWENSSDAAASEQSAIAYRFLSLRTEQLHQNGALLSISLGYTAKAYPFQHDQRPKLIYVWCSQFTQCETAHVITRNPDPQLRYDDASISAMTSLFIATDEQSLPHLQRIRFSKIVSKEGACWQAQVEKSIRLTDRGAKLEDKAIAFLPKRDWMDFTAESTISRINTSPAYLLAGVQPNPMCDFEKKP